MSIVSLHRPQSNRSLPAIAEGLSSDTGEPGVSSEQLDELFALVIHDEIVFAVAESEFREDHFTEREQEYSMLWREAVLLHGESRSPPSLAALRAAVQQRLEEQRQFGGDEVQPLESIITEGGLLDRVSAWPVAASLDRERGRSLLHQFLTERDVLRPVVKIASAPQRSFFGGDRLPTDLRALLPIAVERLDQLDGLCGHSDPWGPPEPLDGPDLPEFPLACLPPVLGDWAEAEATATQTPLDLAAMLGLATFAAAGAKRVRVGVRDGYTEPVNLYVLAVMEPGNRKSAVFADATAPLRQYERAAATAMAPRVRNYERQVRALKRQVERLEQEAARRQSVEESQAVLRQASAVDEQLFALARVTAPKLIVDDATPEKVEMILADQGGRIAIMSAEGGGPIEMMKGRYSGTPQFEVFLKGHSGDVIRTERVGRESVYVESPAITMALTAQPQVLHELSDRTELRGKGLLARFLYAVPRSLLGRRITSPPAVPATVERAYRHAVSRVCHLVRVGEPSALLMSATMHFSREAVECFDEFSDNYEPHLSQWGNLAAIQDWASKLPGAVARLAGILHLITEAEAYRRRRGGLPAGGRQARPRFVPWDTPISLETVTAAIGLADYLIAHAQRAFAMMGMATCPGSNVLADAWHVLRWIRTGHRTTFTRTDVHQKNRGRFRRGVEVDPVLDLLIRKDIIRPVAAAAPGPRGGRPLAMRYRVNPGVFAAEFVVPCGG